MPVRVSVGRIIMGHGDTRKVVEPNTRFNTDDYSVDADTLKQWEDAGVVRKPRDENGRAPADAGPVRAMSEGATVEGRSGPVAGVTSDEPNKQDAVRAVVAPVSDNRDKAVADANDTASEAARRSRRPAQEDEL